MESKRLKPVVRKDYLKDKNPFSSRLKLEFEERRKRNSRYSIRAFAKQMNIDQSLLSKVMSGKKEFSPRTQKKCLELIGVPNDEIQLIVKDIDKIPRKKYIDLDDETFEMISDWHHFAILELLKVDEVKKNPVQEISKRLAMSSKETKSALDRMVSLGFIKKIDDNYRLAKQNNTWASTRETSTAKRKLQKALLEKSIKALEEVDFNLRAHNSLTIAVDADKLPEFKEKLQDILRQTGDILQKSGKFNEVYQLTLSFFPLTNLREKK